MQITLPVVSQTSLAHWAVHCCLGESQVMLAKAVDIALLLQIRRNPARRPRSQVDVGWIFKDLDICPMHSVTRFVHQPLEEGFIL
jgi:hypothetical protein